MGDQTLSWSIHMDKVRDLKELNKTKKNLRCSNWKCWSDEVRIIDFDKKMLTLVCDRCNNEFKLHK